MRVPETITRGLLYRERLRPIRLFPIRAQSASFLLSSATGVQRHASSGRHVKNLEVRPGVAGAGGVLVRCLAVWPPSHIISQPIVGISTSTYTYLPRQWEWADLGIKSNVRGRPTLALSHDERRGECG